MSIQDMQTGKQGARPGGAVDSGAMSATSAPSLMRLLFEQAPQATVLLTPQLSLVAANAAARVWPGLAGCALAGWIGQPFPEAAGAAMPVDDAWLQRLRRSYAELLADPRPVRFLLPMTQPDDGALTGAAGNHLKDARTESIWQVWHAPLFDADGTMVAIATTAAAAFDDAQAWRVASGALPVAGNGTLVAKAVLAATDVGDLPAPGAVSREQPDALHILLVEDSDDLRRMTLEQLELMGHDVTAVCDAEHAMRHLAVRRFDLLFTDLSLPKMTGAELARRVLLEEQAMQVVITSGYGRALANAQNLDAQFLPKPYDFEHLEAVLAQVNRRLGRGFD